jgi:hypothetical protein
LHKYGAERISWQRFSRGFLGSTKSSVNFYFLVTQTTDGPHSHQILPPTTTAHTQTAQAFL